MAEMTPGAFLGAKTTGFGANAWKCEENMYFSLAIASEEWYNCHIIKHQCPFFFIIVFFVPICLSIIPWVPWRRKVASA
ncbi:MAG: hypothetical protein RSJ41_02425 [Clostridia bacterium]